MNIIVQAQVTELTDWKFYLNVKLELNTNISNKDKITKNKAIECQFTNKSAQRYKAMELAKNAGKLIKNTNQLQNETKLFCST